MTPQLQWLTGSLRTLSTACPRVSPRRRNASQHRVLLAVSAFARGKRCEELQPALVGMLCAGRAAELCDRFSPALAALHARCRVKRFGHPSAAQAGQSEVPLGAQALLRLTCKAVESVNPCSLLFYQRQTSPVTPHLCHSSLSGA